MTIEANVAVMPVTPIPPEQARAALRALKTVALASKGLHESEAALLTAARAAFELDDAPESVTPITAEEAAAIIPDPRGRTLLVQAMLLMALMDQEVDPEEVVVIDAFARTLGIDEPRVKNLRQFADGHHLRLKLDVFRRSYFVQHVAAHAWKGEGFLGLYKAFGPRVGLATDPKLAWKYKRLGLLPEGTLGRAYWAHCTEREFSFPGEEHGFPWQVVHDMGHVLGDHDTDPPGEIEQAAFEAGYMKEDPFFLIFSTTMMFHLGFPVLGDDYVGRAKGKFNPAAAAHAYERGRGVNVDLTAWDYWPHLARPIAEVRHELGIPPR